MPKKKNDRQVSCPHEWDPSIFIVQHTILCFFFPGRRCRKCGAHEPCGFEEEQALAAFKKIFRIDFSVFAREKKDDFETMAVTRGAQGWRIAQKEDYRLLKK